MDIDKVKNILSRILQYSIIFGKFVKKKAEQFPFFTKSLILHFIILISLSGLLPTCSNKVEKPKIVEVNIIPQAAPVKIPEVKKPKPRPKAVIKKKVETPPKKKLEKKKPKKQKPKAKPKPKKKKPAPVETKKKIEKVKPKPKKDIPSLKKEKIKEKPKVEPKKPEKPQEKKKDKKQEAKHDQKGKKSLLKDLEKKESIDDLIDDINTKEKAKDEKKDSKSKPAQAKKEEEKPEEFVPDAKFVNEIMSAVQGQISQCWSIPIGAKDVQDMAVKLYIRLSANGTVERVKIIDQKRYNADKYYRVLADSAVWAVKECSPLAGLPKERHEYWKEIEFSFNPASAL